MVARGALASAGIPALIAEEQHGHSDPLIHVGLQGFRLCVPLQALDDGRAVLHEALRQGTANTPSDIPPPRRGLAWGLFIFVGMISLGPAGGFFLQSLRDRGSRVLPVAVFATPVILLVVAAFIFLLMILITLFTHPPR